MARLVPRLTVLKTALIAVSCTLALVALPPSRLLHSTAPLEEEHLFQRRRFACTPRPCAASHRLFREHRCMSRECAQFRRRAGWQPRTFCIVRGQFGRYHR